MGTKGQPNDRLRIERRRRGWTQDDLAERMFQAAIRRSLPVPKGLSGNYVSRWERGANQPDPHDVHLLCLAFELSSSRLGLSVDSALHNVPLQQLDLPPLAPPGASACLAARPFDEGAPLTCGDASREDDDVKRRTLLIGAALGVMAPLELARLLSSRAAAVHVEELKQITNQFASWYWRISPDSLLPLLGDHQARLMSLIRVAPRDVLRPLQIVGSEAAVLTGLTAYKHGDLGTARRQFDVGAELAREAKDGPALAHAYRAQRNVVSTAAVRGGNQTDSARALSVLDAAVASAGPKAAPLQLAMLFATRAEEQAAMGLGLQALRDIDRADRALAQAGPPEVGYYDHWNQARLQGWHASVLLYLDEPAEAVRVLEQVVPATPSELVSDRADVLGDLGAAYAEAGEPEQAVTCLTDSLWTARQGGIDDGVARIRHVRSRQLSSYSELPAVRQLDEQLDDI